jgi:hypothetical protein
MPGPSAARHSELQNLQSCNPLVGIRPPPVVPALSYSYYHYYQKAIVAALGIYVVRRFEV